MGLAFPDYTPPRSGLEGSRQGGPQTVDWQLDAKHYEFWVRGSAQGRFSIPNVRPGTYTLHAFADGVLGEYAKTNVVVAPGQMLNLGALPWTPVRYGRQLWDIGIPNRTAGEFVHGDHYWQWGLYLQYPKDFPNNVNYGVGKSDFRKDWNIMHVPRAARRDRARRRHGHALDSHVHLASRAARQGHPPAGLCRDRVATLTGFMNNSAIHCDSDRGYWTERDVVFDASLMKAGANVLTLTVPLGSITSGVEYDYLRLELAEDAPPPGPSAAE